MHPAIGQNELVDPDDFIRVLEERLGAIAPPGFHVHAGDGMLWYSSDPGRFPGQQGTDRVGRTGVPVRDNLGVFESMREGVIAVAEQALDSLQDYVDEATHDPWPGTTRPPRPFAEVRDSTLFWGYGDPREVVLACGPIPLGGID